MPKNWKIKPLANISDTEFYNYLRKSKLFLSFSYMEGLGAPPIEAAKEGNKVIGYTGEGGKEYWYKPVFSEVPNGNFSKFHFEIIKSIKNQYNKKKFNTVRNKIINKFSPEIEVKRIELMLRKIESLF